MQNLTWHKLSNSRVIFLLACLLFQPGAIAQPARNTIPGYVSHEHIPDASTGASAAALISPQPLQNINTNANLPPRQSAAVVAPAVARGYGGSDFLATTTSLIEGYSIIDYKGLVEGASVRVPTWAEDSAAGSQEVYGGSIASYAQLCEEARTEAYLTLVKRAKQNGANAVIGIHFDSQVMPLDKGKFASGVVCVGTAVTVRRKPVR
ncbi:MAG: YbjQ family protein [Cyanobacteria bacterium REEB67]|nr:YbjQ family protein [Cyanobacteria bacterium REEB67]